MGMWQSYNRERYKKRERQRRHRRKVVKEIRAKEEQELNEFIRDTNKFAEDKPTEH